MAQHDRETLAAAKGVRNVGWKQAQKLAAGRAEIALLTELNEIAA